MKKMLFIVTSVIICTVLPAVIIYLFNLIPATQM